MIEQRGWDYAANPTLGRVPARDDPAGSFVVGHRIPWDRELAAPRIQLDEDGTLDDFYAADVQSVHFEALGDAQWCAVVSLCSGEDWVLYFGAVNQRSKGYARAVVGTPTEEP